MTPFNMWYGGRCLSSISWFYAFEIRFCGTYLFRKSLGEVKFIENRVPMTHSRKKFFYGSKHS